MSDGGRREKLREGKHEGRKEGMKEKRKHGRRLAPSVGGREKDFADQIFGRPFLRKKFPF